MIHLLSHEIAQNWRAQKSSLTSLACYVLLMLLMGYATQNDPAWTQATLPRLAVQWVALLVASLLALERIWQDDARDGVLLQQLGGQIPFGRVILAKSLAFWLTIIWPLAVLFYGSSCLATQSFVPPVMLGSVLLSGLAISQLLTLAGALTLHSRGSGLIISLLIIFPLLVPPLTFGLGVQLAVLDGTTVLPPLALLGATTLFTLVAAPFATFYALSGQRLS